MKLASAQIRVVSDGGFRLDGGAMFGVVPRVLWERRKPPDGRNRIRMATNCLLVEIGGERILIDTGLGDKHDARFRDMFGFEEGARRLPDSLRAAGADPEAIDHVLLTHLHFDHSGWNTRLDGGRLVPTFPNARYWLSRGEVAHARSPNARDRASYDPRNWEPLFETGRVELFDDEAEPVAGVRAVRVPGHNRDMSIVLIGDRDRPEAVFWADLVPTSAHLDYPWIMAYDLYPLETLANKREWLPRAHAGGWLSIFEHDPEVPMARLVEAKPGRFAAEPVETAVGV